MLAAMELVMYVQGDSPKYPTFVLRAALATVDEKKSFMRQNVAETIPFMLETAKF